jgi:PEGA domain
MGRAGKFLSLATAGCLVLIGSLASVPAWGRQWRGGSAHASGAFSRGYYASSYPSYQYVNYGYDYGYNPSYSTPVAPQSYMPNYWWVSPYPLADPRQAGYNPNGGYPLSEVTTLVLTAYPAKSQVTLDGIMVGTADELGPIELPMGEHTLRVSLPGYQPSETVLKVETPTLQQLAVNLKQISFKPQPAPKP